MIYGEIALDFHLKISLAETMYDLTNSGLNLKTNLELIVEHCELNNSNKFSETVKKCSSVYRLTIL